MNKNTILFSLLLVACLPNKETSNAPTPAPTPIVTDTQYCDAAEANLVKLGCSEGKPTKRGKRFGDVCRELHENGIFVNPRCLTSIKQCSEVDVCTRTTVQ